MPQPLPKTEQVAWKGRDIGFGDAEQRKLIKSGYPFMVLDARGDFGERRDIALMVQLFDNATQEPEGSAFIWTLDTSPSRQKLVDQVRSVVYPEDGESDVVGPLHVVMVPNRDSAKSPFMRIANLDEESLGADIPF